MDDSPQLKNELLKRLAELPAPVRDAITSASVEGHLRELAQTHKLHLDQWQRLENEVMMTLVGFEPVQNLSANIKRELDVSDEIAQSLAADITKIVFEPIREELERQLEHPGAKEEAVSAIDANRDSALARKEPVVPAPIVPTITPATPPAPTPGVTVARAPASGAYKPGEASTVRKNVVDDPYREPVA